MENEMKHIARIIGFMALLLLLALPAMAADYDGLRSVYETSESPQ